MTYLRWHAYISRPLEVIRITYNKQNPSNTVSHMIVHACQQCSTWSAAVVDGCCDEVAMNDWLKATQTKSVQVHHDEESRSQEPEHADSGGCATRCGHWAAWHCSRGVYRCRLWCPVLSTVSIEDPERPHAHRAAREGGAVGDSRRQQVQGDAQCRAGRLGHAMCGRSCFDGPELSTVMACHTISAPGSVGRNSACFATPRVRDEKRPRRGCCFGSSSWWASSLPWRRTRRVRYFVGNVATTWHWWSSNGCRIQRIGEMRTGVHHQCTRR